MSETKFTPGPWYLSRLDVLGYTDKTTTLIAECFERLPIDRHIAKANATLIAAAPDLYVELEKLIDEIETLMSDSDAMPYKSLHVICEEGLMPNTKTARAVLAKARGES